MFYLQNCDLWKVSKVKKCYLQESNRRASRVDLYMTKILLSQRLYGNWVPGISCESWLFSIVFYSQKAIIKCYK